MPKLNCYKYSALSARKVLAQLKRLGVENAEASSECAYLAIRFDATRPWEFHFVPKGAITRLKKLPTGTQKENVATAFIGDGVELLLNPSAPYCCQRTKLALAAWLRGDYESALSED